MTMISHPTAVELVRAVAHWIDDVRPNLDARNAYLARVAINALAIVDRELSQSDAAESALMPRLSKLIGNDSAAGSDYESLTRALCERLRNGSMGVDTPELVALLRDDTLAKLAIDQPNYRHENIK
jgi:hypothetical protein